MSPGSSHAARVARSLGCLSPFCLVLTIILSLLLPSVAPAGHLDLTWTAPSTNVDGTPLSDLTTYRIYYGPATGACGGASVQSLAAPLPNPVPGTVVSYQLTGLATGSTYYVQVAAVDSRSAESACSNEVSATALAEGGDMIPPTGTVLLNGDAPYASWTAATLSLTARDLVGVTGYYVSSSATPPTAGAPGWVPVPATTSYTSPTLPYTLSPGDGTKTVYAWFKDAAGNVSAAASDSIVLDQTAPSNGTLAAAAGTGQVTLSWTGVTDSGSGLATTNPYRLVVATGGAPASTCTSSTPLYQGTGTSYTHTGLIDGTTYSYRLCATDNAGNIAAGVTANATPQATTDTTPPTVRITAPTTTATYATSSSALTLGGTAADNVGVRQVTWASDRGGSGTASGTTTWSVGGLTLQSGTNVLTLTAADAAGNTASVTLTVTYTPPRVTASGKTKQGPKPR